MVETAILLSTASNYAVVQLPGRRFPGVVVQGDSTHSILEQLSRIQKLAKKCGDAELDAEIEDICGVFTDINRKFEAVCETHGIELPYSRPEARRSD